MTHDRDGAALLALQTRFQQHVLQADEAVFQDVAQTGSLNAAGRMAIYHHAYRARLLETMRDTFAHTWRYLGDEWFDHLALAFIEQHPPGEANLRWYGEAWPAWLDETMASMEPLCGHSEVLELAQLDWRMRKAFDACNQPVWCVADLRDQPAQAWTDLSMRPQDSVALLTQASNTLALWHALDQDAPVPQAERLPQPAHVLVWRREEQPHFRSVGPLEALALRQLLAGQSFSGICAALAQASHEAGQDDDAAMVAAGILRRWLDDEILARP